jgi:hypothetical protein
VPAEPGTVHALLYVTTQAPDLARLKEPDYIEGWHPAEAACGIRVRTLLPRPYNTEDPGACPKCTERAIRWQKDPAGYRRWVEEREEKRRERRELDSALEEFCERQARDLARRKIPKPRAR